MQSLIIAAKEVPHRIRHKKEGSHIAYMGDELTDVILLVEGTIYTTMTNQDGKELIVETLKGPTLLAPAFIYAENNRLPVNVIAKTGCQLLYINRNAFADMLHRDRQAMMKFIGIISNRLQRLSKRVNNLGLQSLKERVVEYLRENHHINNVEWLSRRLGVARPSLSRVLSELKKEDIVERTVDGIELKK